MKSNGSQLTISLFQNSIIAFSKKFRYTINIAVNNYLYAIQFAYYLGAYYAQKDIWPVLILIKQNYRHK